MKRDGACTSLWQDTAKDGKFNSPADPGKVYDVVIAGAGITGITAGLLLQKAGKQVLIAEAHNVGFGTSGGTTAHLNTFFDTTYDQMESNFGVDEAKLVAKAISESLELIKTNIATYQIDCGYKELKAYLYSQNSKETDELDKIGDSCGRVGVDVSESDDIPFPAAFEKALVFDGQAQFHPLRYIMALAEAFTNAGGILLESCRINGVEEKELVILDSTMGSIQTRQLIYATHIPPGVNLLHFRCAPYRSYAMAVKLAKGEDYPDALVYDMADPYHYFRTQEVDGENYLIAGGEDHKTGHEENTSQCFRNLESFVRKHYKVDAIAYKWSSQYFEPADGLAYIGHLPMHSENVFVATGYGGNGMVYSGIAAILLKDLIVSGETEYRELFDPGRIKMIAGFSNFMKEAADVVGHLVGGSFPAGKLEVLSGLAAGEAKVVKYEGRRAAIYKDEQGNIHAVNPACTHIKCEVAFNDAEKSWDCPCHGSRFDIDGVVLTAPARKDLENIRLGSEE